MDKKMNKWVQLILQTLTFFVGALGGHVAGAALGGKAISTLMGLGVTGGSFYLLDEAKDEEGHKKWIGYFTLGFGGGMITSPVMEVAPSAVQGLSGVDGFAEDAKEGSKNAVKEIALKFHLDKTPLKKFIPNLEGLGTTDNPLTDEQAQKIIDDMLKNKGGMNGSISDDYKLNGSISDDYRLNGSISDDYGMGDLEYETVPMQGQDNDDGDGDDIDGLGRHHWWSHYAPVRRGRRLGDVEEIYEM